MSLKDEILAMDDLRTEQVEVPEWGRTVTLRQLTNEAMDEFIDAVMAGRDDSSVRITGLKAQLLVASIIDDNGELVFGPDDVPALQRKSAAALNRLFEVAQRLNNLGEQSLENALGN